MPCYHPLRAYQSSAGAPVSFSAKGRPGDRRLELPCGQCVGCRLEHARQWSVRCMHEAKLHEWNSFITFTYDASHLPADLSLCHRHFQLFMKRLRKDHAVRYYMCGEYGELNSRPHYHAIVFGFYPTDRQYWSKSKAGYDVYTSAYVDRLWSCGACYVGDVTQESAGYCARYVLKKVSSDGAVREIFDPSTGEIVTRAHEYSRMSLKPGVGADFVKRFAGDVFPHDRVVVRGSEMRVPRYYDVLLDRISPLYLAENKAKRLAKADAAYDRLESENWSDRFTDLKRLKVHEVVKKASVRSLRRG